MDIFLKLLFWFVLASFVFAGIFSINRYFYKRNCSLALIEYLDIDEIEYESARTSSDPSDVGMLILRKLQEKGRLLVWREIRFLKSMRASEVLRNSVALSQEDTQHLLECQLAGNDTVNRERGIVYLCIPPATLFVGASPCLKDPECGDPFCSKHLESQEDAALIDKIAEFDDELFDYYCALIRAEVVFPDVRFLAHSVS